MDIFDISVLLKDGTFADFQVQNERDSNLYSVLEKDILIGKFVATPQGKWEIEDGSPTLEEDLQERIVNQLNGLRQ